MTSDFSPAMVEARIQAAIRPVLEKADALYDHYRPLSEQVIGKHHPMYDTLRGRLIYLRRKAKALGDDVMRSLVAQEFQQIPKRHMMGIDSRDPGAVTITSTPAPTLWRPDLW